MNDPHAPRAWSVSNATRTPADREYNTHQWIPDYNPEPDVNADFEYRVVCADGKPRWGNENSSSADVASGRARALDGWCRPPGLKLHAHTVERRSVGPWEPT